MTPEVLAVVAGSNDDESHDGSNNPGVKLMNHMVSERYGGGMGPRTRDGTITAAIAAPVWPRAGRVPKRNEG
jgi:hypothetical protein